MRIPIAVCLFLTVPMFSIAQPNFEVPKAVPIDEATLTKIEMKIEDLKVALTGLPRVLGLGIREDVEVYHKAAVWMVRHGEYFDKDTAKQTLAVLDAGMERATLAAKGEAPWQAITGKPVIRGYRSRIDGSVQPYSVVLPTDYAKKRGTWRIDIVLHGRNQKLTEVSFIRSKEVAKAPQPTDRITIEVYGRGNNAYRWAGEEDVHESLWDMLQRDIARTDKGDLLLSPVFLRGFSMGGAGAWHIGLHHPSRFRAISPGAGFTTTHGYIKNLPKMPDYQERCLTIYDAVNYAENALNVPVIAYSGEKDGQKAAADNIENALKAFKEPLSFQHLVAPGLEHKQPPEWLAKIESEFAKIEAAPNPTKPTRVRFVTYTLRYSQCDWVTIEGLERHYDRAVVDAVPKDGTATVTTRNVSRIRFGRDLELDWKIVIDGQAMPESDSRTYEKSDGKWTVAKKGGRLRKSPGLQGPIDDVFHTSFRVVGPTATGWADDYAKASLGRFKYEWDKYFRAKLPIQVQGEQSAILFGDPASNPEIAAVLPKLPIQWTAEKLVVNGIEYDSKTHVPVLIYPHPTVNGKYLVLNSGHTFHAAELKGTNAQLYPRLGDWAVLKPKPTKADPAAAEVVAAGIFDENWQFVK